MMTTTVNVRPRQKIGRKLHLDAAKTMANRILFDLKPHCERIALTGAIRREESYIRSIELICVPKMVKQVNLFGNVEGVERSHQFMKEANKLGKIMSGTAEGKFMKFRFEHQDILLELYMTSMEEFYTKLAMTTGPHLYTDITIKDALMKKGYVKSDQGYRHMSECFWVDKKWIAAESSNTGIPAFDSELEFFEWLEINYVTPQHRGKKAIS